MTKTKTDKPGTTRRGDPAPPKAASFAEVAVSATKAESPAASRRRSKGLRRSGYVPRAKAEAMATE